MVAYVVGQMSIHNADLYREYTAITPTTVKRYGGRFLTRGSEVSALEGGPYEKRLVIIEFPDTACAQAWFNDPEYQAAAEYRRASSTSIVLLQEGPADATNPDPNI
ncbi:hypothetical protein KC333_g2838 [Hortaea werneckii]|nr:hypothetical protein KC333_g2838 [Hortaea werneckii]KAI7323911.1 hypothetical protein KC326_g1315 [Hortaea werneckii]